MYVFLSFFLFNWHAIRGMELQEKEGQKDQSIQEICLERA